MSVEVHSKMVAILEFLRDYMYRRYENIIPGLPSMARHCGLRKV